MSKAAPEMACPCGSGMSYRECCDRYHRGGIAPSPEALMRSRFSAYHQHLADYVLESWHKSTRPSGLVLDGGPAWVSLQVLSSEELGDEGRVHFRAIHRDGGDWQFLEERSRFLRESGRWFYVSGDVDSGLLKPGRNDPCPCGSGRKFKNCCRN